MKKLFFLAFITLLAATSSGHANDAYRQGFAQGVAWQRQACNGQSARQVAYLARENRELKRVLMQYRQQNTASSARAASNGYSAQQYYRQEEDTN